MTILSRDDLQPAETRPVPQTCKLSLKALQARLAIGQILRDEYVYEVHGPFVAEEPAQPRLRLAAWMIAKLAGLNRCG